MKRVILCSALFAILLLISCESIPPCLGGFKTEFQIGQSYIAETDNPFMEPSIIIVTDIKDGYIQYHHSCCPSTKWSKAISYIQCVYEPYEGELK